MRELAREITKIALAGAAMTVLLIMFATRPDPAPPAEKDQEPNKDDTNARSDPNALTPSWVRTKPPKRRHCYGPMNSTAARCAAGPLMSAARISQARHIQMHQRMRR